MLVAAIKTVQVQCLPTPHQIFWFRTLGEVLFGWIISFSHSFPQPPIRDGSEAF